MKNIYKAYSTSHLLSGKFIEVMSNSIAAVLQRPPLEASVHQFSLSGSRLYEMAIVR